MPFTEIGRDTVGALSTTKPSGIRTAFIFPPIPIRDFDWSAVQDDYEPGMPVGYGRTEADAVADLEVQMEEP